MWPNFRLGWRITCPKRPIAHSTSRFTSDYWCNALPSLTANRQSNPLREVLLSTRVTTIGILGTAAAILTSVTIAALIEALFLVVGLLAPHSTIDELGPAQFVSAGTRLSQSKSLTEGLEGGLIFIRNLWPSFTALCLTGFILAVALRSFGRARSSWGFGGVLLAIFAVCTMVFGIWTYLEHLALSARLADRDYWADLTYIESVWMSEVGIVALTLLASIPASLTIFTFWRWWILQIARFFVHGVEPNDSLDSITEDETQISHTDYQNRLANLKRDSAELRRLDRDWRRVSDSVLDQTVVVDRDRGRSVPPWMEPMVRLNVVIGKPLLATFALSLALWFGADLVRDSQNWKPQRGEIGITSTQAMSLTLTITEFTKSLRLFGLSGRGETEVQVVKPGNAASIGIAGRLTVDAIDPLKDGLSRTQAFSYNFTGGVPGLYRVVLRQSSGEFARLGYSLGFEPPHSWRIVAIVLGIATASLIVSTAGLTAIAIGNLVSYLGS